MKKLNKKGFTLVEIVIVIVIIAILAAMLIPALTQWIDKSRQKTFLNNCDTIKTAVATAMSEAYAKNSHVINVAQAVKELDDPGMTETGHIKSNTLSKSVGKEVYIVEPNTYMKQNNTTAFRVDKNSWADNIAITDGKYSVMWIGGDWTAINNLDKTEQGCWKVNTLQRDAES